MTTSFDRCAGQVVPSSEPGFYDYAVVSDYIVAAVEKARVVIGEINHAAPRVPVAHRIPAERFACLVETERPVLAVPAAAIEDVERAIARHIADHIDDGSTLQVGIGAVPDAVMALVADRKDLGIHSGMIGDSVVDLVEKGVVTNARKGTDRGLTVTGTLIGTEKLYRFADCNRSILMRTVASTHSHGVLAVLPRLVAINSAIEIDLGGQVNAEVAGGVHIGAVGGQVDFVRGAVASAGGRSIIALPSTAAGGRQSRIVSKLSGPVTTARSDADLVVTEFGVAELRGRDLAERARALAAIARPAFRDELQASASA